MNWHHFFMLWGIASIFVGALSPAIVAQQSDDSAPKASHENRVDDSSSTSLGVSLLDVDKKELKAVIGDILAPVSPKGLLVAGVVFGGPAYTAGIRVGDVLHVIADEQIITTGAAFAEWMKRYRVAEKCDVTVFRLVSPKGNGMGQWRRMVIQVVPQTISNVEMIRLRHSFVNVDGKWIELPKLDITRPSSQKGVYKPDRGYYNFRLKNGTMMGTTDPSRKPAGAVNVTAEVNAKERREWEERMPALRVGEFGQVCSAKVFQVLG